MTLSASLYILLISFFASITFNGFFRSIAKKNKILIDLPDKSRKFHKRATPLTGGISIFAACLLSAFLLEGLSDLTGIHVETNINNEKLLKDNNFFIDKIISKKYKIAGKNYETLVKTDQESDSISIDVVLEDGSVESLKITPTEDGNLTVLLPDNSLSSYKYQDGEVINISDINEQRFKPLGIENFGIKIGIFSISMLFCAFLIIIFMLVDDIRGIKASYRLIFQISIVLLMIFLSGESLKSLGNLLGSGEISLGFFSVIFTVFCVVGLINAFNMSDGLNGICASLGLMPLIMIFFYGHAYYGLLIPIGALIGFLSYNLGYFGEKRRVFLGDTGSNCLGFLLAMTCIELSQNGQSMHAVTALWLVAIPMLDCVGVMTSRLLKGIQPFRPGRDHLHYKLLDSGFSGGNILLIFIVSSTALAAIGLQLNVIYPDKEYISFYSFVLFSVAYYVITKYTFKNNAQPI
jgi:UDP-GlcNAc:undecaprenyl-phosphate GlcNAc-1-phosphate transferase